MIYDSFSGQLLSDATPFEASQSGWYFIDHNAFDTVIDYYYFDRTTGAYFYYPVETSPSSEFDISQNSLFNGTLFQPIDEVYNSFANDTANSSVILDTLESPFLGNTGNFVADQSIGLTNGLLAGGDPSFATANQGIVNNGGLQNLPLGGFGSNF